jgi:hypothetical protein
VLAFTSAYFFESSLFKGLRAIQTKKIGRRLQLASQVAAKPIARSILSCSLSSTARQARGGFCQLKYIAQYSASHKEWNGFDTNWPWPKHNPLTGFDPEWAKRISVMDGR